MDNMVVDNMATDNTMEGSTARDNMREDSRVVDSMALSKMKVDSRAWDNKMEGSMAMGNILVVGFDNCQGLWECNIYSKDIQVHKFNHDFRFKYNEIRETYHIRTRHFR